jgi:polyisoprenoid-binding protein YceI
MATSTSVEIPAGTWVIDDAHSTAAFEVEHGGLSTFRGTFSPIQAKLTSDGSSAVLEGSVRVGDISVDDDQIRPHLLSPEFFDAERNPQIAFRSTAIEGTPDDLRVTGELSLAGATRTVEATGRLRGPVDFGAAEKISVTLHAAIDRTDYGMDWQMQLPGGGEALGNEVRLNVELELVKS